MIVGELVAGAHRELGRRLSPLGDLLVTQLQLRLQVLLWEEKRKEVSQLGTPVEERDSPGWTHEEGRWAVRDRDVGPMKREIGGRD